MATVTAARLLSTTPAAPDDRQLAPRSKPHPDCRSTTIKSRVAKISLALPSRRDNHPPAATAEMAILIVAVFPSRLSRYRAGPLEAGHAFSCRIVGHRLPLVGKVTGPSTV